MRSGRSVRSAITPDSDQSQVVAYFTTNRVLSGFVDAAIVALRDGIPAHRIPNQALFTAQGTSVVVDSDEQQIQFWKDRLDDAEARVSRAKRLSMDPNIEEDEAKEYQAEGRKHREAAREARTRLEELQRLDSERDDAAGAFDVHTDVWLRALGRVATCTGHITQAEYRAFGVIVPSMRFEVVDGIWWGTATIRVNTNEGVAELGPIVWKIGRGGVGVATLTATSDIADTGGASRKRQRHALLESGRLLSDAAKTSVASMFPQVQATLLHSVCGQPWPDWVGPQWREPVFVDWITKIYTDPAFRWLGKGKWGRTSALRQFVADVLSERGPVLAGDLNPIVGGDVTRALHAILSRAPSKEKIRRWNAPFTWDADVSPRRLRTLTPLRCCGGGIVATRVPEVLSDALCTCGRMLDGERFGAPEDLRFPDEYQQLRIPAAQALAECRERFGPLKTLSPKPRAIMAQATLLTNGATELQIGAAVPTPSGRPSIVSTSMAALEAFGFVTSDGGRPKRWSYTEAGREAADRLDALDALAVGRGKEVPPASG